MSSFPLPAEPLHALQEPQIERQLNVTDALTYLDSVKAKFVDRPDVYNIFLDIMKEFKSQQYVYFPRTTCVFAIAH